MKEGQFEKKMLKIGEIAAKAKIPVSTIRYYTEQGLISVSAYTDGGQFLYDEEKAMDGIRLIQELSNRGLSIKQIKDFISGQRDVKKIAIVDDDADFAKMIRDFIVKHYPIWDVKISLDVFRAGNMLSEFLPDLVVLDLFLPGVKGFEICKFIRSHPAIKKIKVLAASSHDTKKNKDEIMSCGADAFLGKPVDLDEFLSTLNRLLNI